MDDNNISEKWTAFASVLAHGINNSEIRCKSSRGLLYAVTSNLLNGIKVGFWRGSHTRLLGRYSGQYGTDLEMITFPTENVDIAEREAFEEMEHMHLCNELYRKNKWAVHRCVRRCAARHPCRGVGPGDVDQYCIKMSQARQRWGPLTPMRVAHTDEDMLTYA